MHTDAGLDLGVATLVTCTRARTGIAIPAVPTEFDGGALALAQGRGECTSPGPSLPPYMEQV